MSENEKEFPPVVTYEIWQDGWCQAGADNLPDATHYFAMYSQDGDCELRKVTSTYEVIASCEDI